MGIRVIPLEGTTDGSGDQVITARTPWGKLIGFLAVGDATLDDGADITLECLYPGMAAPDAKLLFTLTNMVADAFFQPTVALQDDVAADVANTESPNLAIPVVGGVLRLTVDEGGVTKAFSFAAVIEV